MSDRMSDPGTQDRELRALLKRARTVAVVGLSSRPDRPSFQVAAYLQRNGYRIVPVNPSETEVLGETAYPSLLELPEDVHVDVVDVFRRAEHTPEIARQAVAVGAKTLWLQEGIVSDEAAAIASDAGLDVIMGVCMRHVRQRLMEMEPDGPTDEPGGLAGGGKGSWMTTWEYFVAPLLEHNPGDILNTFGSDGWELVSVVQQQTPMGGASTIAYLKRAKA